MAAFGGGDGRRDDGDGVHGIVVGVRVRLVAAVDVVGAVADEVKWVIPITSQTLPLSLFALGLAFSLPLTIFAVCPSLQVLCRLGPVHQQG